MARGYTPSLAGLPQIKLSEDIIEAYEEQAARRAVVLLEKSRNSHTKQPEKLSRYDMVYVFKRGPKFGTWEIAYVRDVEDHAVVLSSSKAHKGKPVRAAYEDLRLVPSAPLLQDLDKLEFVFPRSYSIIDEGVIKTQRRVIITRT